MVKIRSSSLFELFVLCTMKEDVHTVHCVSAHALFSSL